MRARRECGGGMDRGGLAPRPARDVKHTMLALVGLARKFWPISNTPIGSQSVASPLVLIYI
jgi:hypothetical protein